MSSLREMLPSVDAIDKRLAEVSLGSFIEQAWHVIEPNTEYKKHWHIDLMCEYLESVTSGEITRLIINIPPRYMKSIAVSVMWPCWEWGPCAHPSLRYLFTSYSATLSTMHSVTRRRLLESDWYKSLWPGFRMSSDVNTKMEFENTKRGLMVATSMGGTSTGRGGDRVVIDDPLNPKEAASDLLLDTVNESYDSVFSTRLDDKLHGAIVLIMQRLHERDLTGHILSKEHGWDHVVLPAIAERHSRVVFPRTLREVIRKENEVLWEERESKEQVDAMKIILGSYGFCTPGETPILMADWTTRPIKDVRAGDQVVGFKKGNPNKRAHLKVSTVREVYTSPTETPVVRLKMESGRKVRCTPDHRWYTARDDAGHPIYSPPSVGRRLMFVCPPYDNVSEEEARQWFYLAGIVDGEGSIKNPSALAISQSPEANGPTFNKIGETLDALGLDYKVWTAPSCPEKNWSAKGQYQVNDVFNVYRKLIRIARPAKSAEMAERMIHRGHMFIREKDRVEAILADGAETVYGLTTTTGNYIAWGYASENSSQYQQRPAPRGGGMLRTEWWQRYDELPTRFDTVIQSWDTAFKGGATSDYVVGQVWGRVGPDCYLIDQVRGRWTFLETVKQIELLARKYPDARLKLVEDSANGPAVIDMLKRKVQGLVSEKVDTNKETRVAAIQPLVEAGNVYIPTRAVATWVDDFLDEMMHFPKGVHDDMVDAMSQALLRLSLRSYTAASLLATGEGAQYDGES